MSRGLGGQGVSSQAPEISKRLERMTRKTGATVVDRHGRVFRKSSFSPFTRSVDPRCIAVHVGQNEILLTDFANCSVQLKFTKDEWEAFILGVKDGEFDV